MKKILFICVCSLALMSTSASALRFGAPPLVKVKTRTYVQFLSAENESLNKALDIHNLMTELMPLQVMAEQQNKMKDVEKKIEKYYKKLEACNEKRLGRFKNPKEVLGKVRTAYKEKAAAVDKELADQMNENNIVPLSVTQKNRYLKRKKALETEVFTAALSGDKKYGGKPVDRKKREIPDDLQDKMAVAGLEEMMNAGTVLGNTKLALADYSSTFSKMQAEFVAKLAKMGLKFPTFNAARSSDVREVKKAMADLKEKYLEEAKAHIQKLDEQDKAYPQMVAARTKKSEKKERLFAQVKESHPDAFNQVMSFDKNSPQQLQQNLIVALEKDKEGIVFLTQTNALEVDQKIAEAKANKEMIETFKENMPLQVDENAIDNINFDEQTCSV